MNKNLFGALHALNSRKQLATGPGTAIPKEPKTNTPVKKPGRTPNGMEDNTVNGENRFKATPKDHGDVHGHLNNALNAKDIGEKRGHIFRALTAANGHQRRTMGKP